MSNTYNVGWLRDNENQIFIPFTYTKSVKLDDKGNTLDSTVTTVGEHSDKISTIEGILEELENGTTHVGVADSTKGTLTIGDSTFNGSTDVTITAKDLGITGALVYAGISTTVITDGGTENPYINNVSVSTSDLKPGNIVLYKDVNSNIYQEFLWTGNSWELLGDEGSYALKSISIIAGEGISGGGTLREDVEVNVNPDGITIVITDGKVAMNTSGVTAGNYGQNVDVPDLQPEATTEFNVPYITVDKYGRVTSASTKTIQIVTDTGLSDSISNLENRSIIAGAGLTGGGNLTDSRTLNVGAGDGIQVNADSIQLATSGVTAGNYGADVGDNTYHLSFNEEVKIPYITVDKYGRVVAASTETIKMPDDTEIHDLLTTIIADIAGEDGEIDNIVPRLANVETRTKYLNASTEDGAFQITDKNGYVGLQVDNNGTSSFDFILIKSEEESISLTEKLAELESKDTQLGDSITDLNTDLNNKISNVNTNLTNLINNTKSDLQKEISDTADTINETIEGLQESLEAKDKSLEDSITNLEGRSIIAGKGLTGGGTLAESRTLNVIAGDGIQVNDDSVQLATSGVTAGSYGQSSNYTSGFDGSFTIPFIKVDKYGRITEATSITINMPSDDDIVDKIGTLENVTITGGDGLSGSGKLSDGTITLAASVDRGLNIVSDKIGHSNSITSGTINGTSGNVDFSGKIIIPKITYDSYGHITAVATTEVILPSITSITDAITALETNSATKTELTNAINNLQSQINLNKTNIESNDTDITNLTTRVGSCESNISSIQAINTAQSDAITELQTNSATKEQLTTATNNLQSQINTNKTNIESNDADILDLQDRMSNSEQAIEEIQIVNGEQNDTISVLQDDIIILDTRTKYMDASAPDEFHITDESGYPGFTFGTDGIARAGDFITSSTTDEDNNISLKETKKALDTEIQERKNDQQEIVDTLSKMDITAGSNVKPIYFDSGTPTVCDANFTFYQEISESDVDSTGSAFYVLKTGDAMSGPLISTGFIGPLNGNATSADKLNTDAGSSTLPIYFLGGIPTVCDDSILLPTGGSEGHVLIKNSSANGDASWKELVALPKGGEAGQVLIKNSTTDGDASWLTHTLTLTGDVTGSGSFDSAGNLSITTTVADDSHNHSFLTRRATNTITNTTDDTTTNWGAYSTSVHWYNTASQITNQPATYGYILNIGYGSETQQLWFSAPGGGPYYRGGNGSGWSTSWKKLWLDGDAITGAVWNDYAECRESDCEEFGYVLMENGDDSLTKTTERLSHFAGVSSDTWGFSQGKTDKAKTPIAVAGRVLVYPYQDRNNYRPGDCVCAAPGGTVDIMTREEVINWPDRIVGTVSCVPDYEEWGGGENADRPPVKVNNRIWIKVK